MSVYILIISETCHRMCTTVCLQVEEWQGRTCIQNGSSVVVKEHKTATSQVAEVPLTADQEHVRLYSKLHYNCVRVCLCVFKCIYLFLFGAVSSVLALYFFVLNHHLLPFLVVYTTTFYPTSQINLTSLAFVISTTSTKR